MTVKEFKTIVQGIGESIDRIAGFCDNYEQMFEQCKVEVLEPNVEINTLEDFFEPWNMTTVPEAIAQILALPEEMDDHIVLYVGEDNKDETEAFSRDVCRINTVQGITGIGISLQGAQQNKNFDLNLYVTKLFVGDERAKTLNKTIFCEFLEIDINGGDEAIIENRNGGIYIQAITNKHNSAALIALMAGTFQDVVFCRVPLDRSDKDIYRLTNDREGRFWGKRAVIYAPADNRYSRNADYEYSVMDIIYIKKECDTEQEVEQFIAGHKPDKKLGDIVVRFVSRYIDNPLDLILKPWPEDDYE
ncbi:MAG: hypothetical protein J6N71_08395 [Muribaculaceae bacterium]|nr:hypothetical protein [Muribaculaceae bacterium]